MVTTPSNQAADSPGESSNPMAAALRRKEAFERACLFVQGKHDELLKSMTIEQKV